MTFVAVLVACLAPVPQVQLAQKLNAPLDFAIVEGDVTGLQASGNGSWLSYSAQQEDPSTALYVVKRDGSVGPLRITPPGTGVLSWRSNHVGDRLVVMTDPRTLLVAAPGSALTALTPPLASDRSISDYSIAPGGQYVLYRANAELLGRRDLYSVPLYGPASATKLGQRVDSPSVYSRDGARVLFGQPVSNVLQLFSAPVDASAGAVQVSNGLPSGSFVAYNAVPPATDPSGQKTVFVADDAGKQKLFVAPTDGSGSAQSLSGPIVNGGDVTDFRIAPGGQRVVYVADALVNNRFELFSVPIDGSAAPVALSGARTPLGVFTLASSTDVVFEAEVRGRLFRAALDGLSAPVQLTPSGGDASSVLGVEEIRITSDGARAVYVISPSNFFAEELRSVPLDGSAPSVFVCPPLSVNEFVRRFEMLPDGDVLYLAGGIPVSNALYRRPADGSTAPVALHALGSSLSGTAIDFEVGNGDVAFRSDLAAPQETELFVVPLGGGSAPVRRSGELYWTRGFDDVEEIGVSGNGRFAAYATAAGIDTVATAAPGVATRVVAADVVPSSLDLASDPLRFTYEAFTPDGHHLFSAPYDGSAPPQQLSTGTWALPFGVAAHRAVGPWILYSTSGYFGPEGSYVVAADGSSAPWFLSNPFVLSLEADSAGSRILWRFQGYPPSPTQILLRDPLAPSSFEVAPVPGSPAYLPEARAASFSPDGARVVFVRDQETEQHFELYGVLAVAGASPVTLSGSLPPTGDVAPGLTLVPDGTGVVFAADRDVDDALQLFVSALDGSGAPRELSPVLAPGESVAVDAAGLPLVWVTPDSTRVLFALQSNARLLLSVPLDGSAAPVLVGPLPAAGAGLASEFDAVRFTPDGQSVVFRSALAAPDRFELCVAPSSGGVGLQLTATPGPLQDVEDGFRVLRNGHEVLFRGDLGEDERQELWLVPVDASRPPRRVSALGPHDADVEPDFVLAADESHVYYRADAERDGEIEFFRYPLRTPPVRRR